MTDYALKIRLYPNKEQQSIIFQTFGNCRFVYNRMLEMLIARHKNNKDAKFPSKYSLMKLLPILKNEYPFLKRTDSTAYQYEVAFLWQAYKDFFKKKKGFPHFHSRKSDTQSYTTCSSALKIFDNRHIQMPKLGYIYTNKIKKLPTEKPYRATLSYDASGKFYLAMHFHGEKKPLNRTNKMIGIDVGIADLAILSDGTRYATFKATEEEKAAKIWQKKFSKRKDLAKRLVLQDKQNKVLFPRSVDDFSGWQKARRIKAKYQARIANKRHDYLEKITTELVRQYDVIAIEDLKVKNLQKNHHLAKAISNASWHLFRTMLEYKCEWYGKKLIAVDPKNTSRICSKCQFNSGEKPLDIREWTCPKCHTHHDRDINAAINILNRAKKQLSEVEQ